MIKPSFYAKLLIPLLASVALPTITYGFDIDYFNSLEKRDMYFYGAGYSQSEILCRFYKNGRISKKSIMEELEIDKQPRETASDLAAFCFGWNEGFWEGCEFLKIE